MPDADVQALLTLVERNPDLLAAFGLACYQRGRFDAGDVGAEGRAAGPALAAMLESIAQADAAQHAARWRRQALGLPHWLRELAEQE